MAITEVYLDFTYNYEGVVELEMEGDETNPSTQVVYGISDEFASSVANFDIGNEYASSTIIIGDIGSIFEIGIGTGFIVSSVGSLSKNTLEVRMEGSLLTGAGFVGGALDVVEINAVGTMHTVNIIKGDSSVTEIQIEGSAYVRSNISMDKELVLISMSGSIIQGGYVDEGGVFVPDVILADDDTEYPNISGEEYIVLNLRTKAHSTYRDGERTAAAKTATLDFGSSTSKAVSDLFMLSRAKGPIEVIMNTGEDIDRLYQVMYGETTQANLKNKKLKLGKGLKAANWSVMIVVPEDSHLEVRSLDLFVTDLKRHF